MISTSDRATRRGHLLIAASALAAALVAAPAFAADDPAPAQQGEMAPDGDIVVTATRRAESAKDVPIAVTAVAGEKLDVINSSGLDIRFLAARVPSLQVESSFGRTFPRFYIRGLGNTDFDPNAQQPVSVVYDDVALENPMLKSFPVFDLASVQVLRGPQGTLFGRNTPAGVIKLDSARPDPDDFGGFLNVSLGTYMTLNAQAAVNVPLGGGWALRVSAIDQSRDNWVHNDSTSGYADRKLEGYQDVAGRIQLGYSGGDFNLLVNVHGRDLDGTPRLFRAGMFKPGTNDFNDGFDPRHVAIDGYTSQTMTQWGANLRMDYHLAGLGTFYSVSAYEKADVTSIGDIDGGNCPSFLPGCTIGDINVGLFPSNTGDAARPEEFSQELRFVSEEMGGFVVQGGAYYFHQNLKSNQLAYAWPPTGGPGADLIQDVTHDNKADNWGVFAAVDWKATDALTLRAGGRYSHDKKHDIIAGYSPDVTPGHPLPQEMRVSDGEFTWDLNATYAVSRTISVYGRVATGYLGPAIQDRWSFGSFQLSKPKQTTLSFEGGVKGSMRGLNFALDAYYHRTHDLQLTQVGGSGNTARLLSVDKAVGYGVEAEVEARPAPNLQLTASGSYNFTEMRSPGLAVSICSTCTVLDPVVNGQALIDGNDLPQAPRWVANWTVRYGIPLADGSEIYAFTDWAYRSEINFFLYDSVEFTGKSQLEGGLKLGYRTAGGLEVGAFARNITNQYRAISGIDFNNLTGMINEPRIIGGFASVRF